MLPAYGHNPPPPYPRVARRRGLEGTVLLRVLVDDHGRPARVRLVRSSGRRILDRAAVRAVRAWRFVPGQRAGRPAAMWVEVPVSFRLRP